MITATPTHGLREDLDTLLGRLARIDAQRVTLAGVGDSLHGAPTSQTLARVLDSLERDLTLTARDADRIHERALNGGSG